MLVVPCSLRRHVTCLLAACAVLAAIPAAAQAAATVTVAGGVLTYTDGGAAEVNIPVVTFETGPPARYTVEDTGTTLVAGAGCVLLAPARVACDDLGIRAITITLGAGNDPGGRVDAAIGLAVTLNAGDGNDSFTTGSGNDTLTGGIGNDTLGGGAGGDRFNGGDGDDSYDGGTGDDKFGQGSEDTGSETYTGGPGTDLVSYRPSTRGVTIRLDDVRNDGTAGEDDVRSDVENLEGSERADTIVGSAAGNVLLGLDGSDLVEGGGGDDWIVGTDLVGQGSGDDTMRGGDGNDWFWDGGAGRSTIQGDGGDDLIWAGPGPDDYSGGPGSDRIDWGGGTYQNATDRAGVRVTFDQNADDGYPGEGDFARPDVEEAAGGFGPDTFFGSAARNVFLGAGGVDVFNVRDGNADLISCGGDQDVVIGDGFDSLLGDGLNTCEVADLTALPGPAAPTLPAPPPLTARFASTRVSGGIARVAIACGAAATGPCQGAATLTDKGRRVGAETFVLSPGERETVEIALTSRAVKALRRGRLAVILRVVATDDTRLSRLVRVSATLRRR